MTEPKYSYRESCVALAYLRAFDGRSGSADSAADYLAAALRVVERAKRVEAARDEYAVTCDRCRGGTMTVRDCDDAERDWLRAQDAIRAALSEWSD